jgi:phosphoribosylglycinamide formyltransferase 1
LPGTSTSPGDAMTRKRVAVLISGRGSNMVSLIEAAKAKDYPAEIALVISNRPDAAGLELGRKAGVPTLVVDHRPHGKDRAAFERVLQHALDEQRIELICLAGFMRLFTANFVLHWQGRMLNIHPALLPSFPGLDPHGQALKAGVRISGATVHFVIPETDAGPIIAQVAVPVREGDTADTLAARVLAVEHQIYPLALKLVAQGRVRIVDGRCSVEGSAASDGVLMSPHD